MEDDNVEDGFGDWCRSVALDAGCYGAGGCRKSRRECMQAGHRGVLQLGQTRRRPHQRLHEGAPSPIIGVMQGGALPGVAEEVKVARPLGRSFSPPPSSPITSPPPFGRRVLGGAPRRMRACHRMRSLGHNPPLTDFVAAAGRGLECPPPAAAPTQGHHHRQSACTGSAKAIAPAFAGVRDWCIVPG